MSLVEDAESFAFLDEEAFPQLVAYFDFLVVLRHHFGDVALTNYFCMGKDIRSFYS